MLIALFSGDPIDARVADRSRSPALQQLEGHVVAPNVFGQALRINPLLVIFALLLGGQLYGFIGAFIALPIAADRCARRRLPAPPPAVRALGPADRRPSRPHEPPRRPRRAAAARSAARRRPDARRAAARRAGPSSAGLTPRRPPRRARARGRTCAATRLRADGVIEALRRPRRAARRLVRASPRRAGRGDRPQRRRQDDAAVDPRRRASSRTTGAVDRATAAIGWVPQQPALYSQADGGGEPAPVRAAREGRRRRERPSRGCSSRPTLGERADDEVGKLSGGNRQRVNIAIGLLADPAVLLLDEPSAVARPAPARAPVGVHRRARRRGTTVLFSTHDVGEAERYADRVLVLADGELLFTGTPRELERDGRRRRGARLRGGVRRASCHERGPTVMRWLLLKDLQILRRSPLLVGAARPLPDRRSRC